MSNIEDGSVHTEIPKDIKIGDVFKKSQGKSPLCVYLGKANAQNLNVFESLKLKSVVHPNPVLESIGKLIAEKYPHFFATFYGDAPQQICLMCLSEDLNSINDFGYEQRLELAYCANYQFSEGHVKLKSIIDKAKSIGEKKVFVSNVVGKHIRCSQGGKFVKYANEVDDRIWANKTNEVDFDFWKPINIDYPAYLFLTGLRERSKEDELAEIKAKLISKNSLGCQKDALTPIVEKFLGLIDDVNKYNKDYRNQVVIGMKQCLDNLKSPEMNDIVGAEYCRTRDLLVEYVKVLKS